MIAFCTYIWQVRVEGFKKQQHHSNPQDYIHVIEKDDSSSSWSADYDENHDKRRSCRQCLARGLASTKCHCYVVITVLAVVALMIVELCLILSSFQRRSQYGSLIIHVLHSLIVTVLFLFIVEIFVRLAVFRTQYCR